MYHLTYERVDSLPQAFTDNKNLTQLENLIFYKISLPRTLSKPIDQLTIYEYHKGRREPYPKTIKVYEKQTVELYESMYFMSVYHSLSSEISFRVQSSDVKYYNEKPTNIEDEYMTYGPFLDIAPVTFHQI